MNNKWITITQPAQPPDTGPIPLTVTVRLPPSVERVTDLVVLFFPPDDPPNGPSPSLSSNGMILVAEDGEFSSTLDSGHPSVVLRPRDNPILVVDRAELTMWQPAVAAIGAISDLDEFEVETVGLAANNNQLIIIASQERWAPVFEHLASHPHEMRSMKAREFEEFVAALLERRGMEVELTPQTRDGGRDILARAETVCGRQLYLIETKRFAEGRKVGVGIIRGLYGVVEKERATGGLVVTTSSFTKPAIDFQRDIELRMGLADFRTIVEWIGGTQGPRPASSEST